jgi:hypothetical protein
MRAVQRLLFADPRPLVERLGREFFLGLPETPGVYLMLGGDGTVLYVGKAVNLRKRLGSYRVANPDRMPARHLRLLRAVERIELRPCSDEASALKCEAELLLALKPRFNRAGTWAGPLRFLAWRLADGAIELKVAKEESRGWSHRGPMGGRAAPLRVALARTLWRGLYPGSSLAELPYGWIHGRLPEVAMVHANAPEQNLAKIATRLDELLTGQIESFLAWAGEPSETGRLAYEQEIIAADLETIARAMGWSPPVTPELQPKGA